MENGNCWPDRPQNFKKHKKLKTNKMKNKIIIAICLLLYISSCKTNNSPKWVDINEEIIKEYNVKGRSRLDIPDTKIPSNLEDAKVVNIKKLPIMKLADGVTAKAYWGKGALMSFITLDPNSEMPSKTIEGERFMFVLEGEVDELIGGHYKTLKAIKREEPGPLGSGTPKREFVYLQDGAISTIKAGATGAKILEVYSPVPKEYLELAGYDNIPEPISINEFPVAPNVKSDKIYDLDKFQYTELVPGANSRIISGKGIQMSFLRMNANSTFARHIHPEEQTMIVLRGWIDEIVLDDVIRMKEGDIVNLPPNLVHGGDIGPYGCDVLDVFFAPRTDYDSFRMKRKKGYNNIVSEGVEVELLIDGSKSKPQLTFTEGPAWLNGKLYFSNMFFDENFNGDPTKSTLVEMDPDGNYRNIVKNKMQTNGIIPTSDNHLIVCDMFGNRIIKIDTNGNILKVIADTYNGKSIDGPNDLVMDSKGGIYFTDPQFNGDAVKNQPGRSVYYLAPTGKIIRLVEPDSYAMPNGVALSPDGKTLYINNTHDDKESWDVNSDKENFIWAYDIQEDGSIANKRRFAELYLTANILDLKEKSSGADGMKVDVNGNLYVATYAGIQIFNNSGEFVGIINLPDYPVNCAFGGSDRKTLYITTHDKVYSIQTNIEGFINTSL